MLLQEPLLVIGSFYLLFLVIIIYVRLDFSITKVNIPLQYPRILLTSKVITFQLPKWKNIRQMKITIVFSVG